MRKQLLVQVGALGIVLLGISVMGRGNGGSCPPASAVRGPAFRLEAGGTRSGMRGGEEVSVFCDKVCILRLKLKCANKHGISYALDVPPGTTIQQDLYDADKDQVASGKVLDLTSFSVKRFHEAGTKPESVFAYRYLFHTFNHKSGASVTVSVPEAAWEQWCLIREGKTWMLMRKVDEGFLSSLKAVSGDWSSVSATDVYLRVYQHVSMNDSYGMQFRTELPWPPNIPGLP